MKSRLELDSGPLETALVQAGCESKRAKACATQEGYGITTAPALMSAYQANRENVDAIEDESIQFCAQCKPGTNTFAYWFSKYSGKCFRVPIDLDGRKIQATAGVLCLGRDRKLEYRSSGEFLTISHVWSHGWQGVSEDGICSRVLDMLLSATSYLNLEWIWLDVAMISGIEEIRTMSINAMNEVYSTAAATLVCDRLLLSMKGGTDREKALAVAVSDWYTRLWTMQEAILSRKLVFLQQDRLWDGRDLMMSLVYSCSDGSDNR